MTFRGETLTAHAGETINVPANAPHAFTNAEDSPSRLLCLCAPAGQDEFFTLVGQPVASRTEQPPPLDPAAQAAFIGRSPSRRTTEPNFCRRQAPSESWDPHIESVAELFGGGGVAVGEGFVLLAALLAVGDGESDGGAEAGDDGKADLDGVEEVSDVAPAAVGRGVGGVQQVSERRPTQDEDNACRGDDGEEG